VEDDFSSLSETLESLDLELLQYHSVIFPRMRYAQRGPGPPQYDARRFTTYPGKG
jgi:methionyl-tRNA synthetase